jgi:hypothetical protein
LKIGGSIFACEMLGGGIKTEAGMAEETQETKERKDVCAFCLRILGPDDFVGSLRKVLNFL